MESPTGSTDGTCRAKQRRSIFSSATPPRSVAGIRSASGTAAMRLGWDPCPRKSSKSGIPNGKVIAATTPVDSLIVAGVSNWGGYGLLAAMACTKPAFVRARDHDMGRISLFRVQRARDLFMSAREPFVSARHGADQFVSGSAWNALALHTQSNVSRIRAARGFPRATFRGRLGRSIYSL